MRKTGTKRIKTNRLVLRKIYPWDIFTVYPWYTSSEISRFALCRRAFTPLEAFKLCFGRCLKYHNNDYYYWGIRYNGKISGILNVYPSKRVNGRYGICFKVDSRMQNQGIASEAVKAVLDYFKTQEISEIIGRCDVDNIASKRVMEKSGMTSFGDPETNAKIKYDTGETAKACCFKFTYN